MISRQKLGAAVLVVGLVAALPEYADCVLPPAPSKVPDGVSASEQEMLMAMKTLKQYNGDVEVYLKCLEFEAKQNRMTATEQRNKHNAAITQLEKIATQFNEQVRVYKAKG